MLAEKVAAGELPPIEERLPADPLVIEPVEEVGQYGGTWRMVDNDNTNGWLRQTVWVEPLLKWNRDLSGMRPNLLETYSWNDDATVLTAKFREGIKWSDGEPLTADDFLFWWNDMIMDPDLGLTPPGGTTVGGAPMQVEKVDDYTLTFTFAAPNPLFLDYLSRGSYNSSWFVVPAHYMKQFHPKYNTDVTDTTELLNRYSTNSRLQYVDMPTFTAWMVTEYVPGERVRLERNPYYWKVDTAGNQLPYIDSLDVQIPQGNATELVLLKALAGELDMQTRDIELKDVPLVMENADANGYHVVMWNRGDYAWPWLMLMYDYPDEGIVDLMYTQEFRQALSYAIDRDTLNNVVHLGLAKPRQFALSAESPEFRSEEGQKVYNEWVKSYAEFDPEKAKSLLDGIGVKDVDGDGLRERPDGTPLELIVDIPSSDKLTIDSMDFIQKNWQDIGLKTTLNIAEGSIIDQRANAGETMIRAWGSAAAWGLDFCADGVDAGRSGDVEHGRRAHRPVLCVTGQGRCRTTPGLDVGEAAEGLHRPDLDRRSCRARTEAAGRVPDPHRRRPDYDRHGGRTSEPCDRQEQRPQRARNRPGRLVGPGLPGHGRSGAVLLPLVDA